MIVACQAEETGRRMDICSDPQIKRCDMRFYFEIRRDGCEVYVHPLDDDVDITDYNYESPRSPGIAVEFRGEMCCNSAGVRDRSSCLLESRHTGIFVLPAPRALI